MDPASAEPLRLQFTDAGLQDILDFIGNATGINVTYDQQFQDRAYSVRLNGVTIEEALDQILTANQYFYKVINSRSLIVVPDTPQKRAQYEEQVIRTFYISNADVQELATLLSQIVRVPQMAVPAADRAEHHVEHDHGACHDGSGRHHRAGDRLQRQAASRDRRRHCYSGSQPRTGSGVWARPDAVMPSVRYFHRTPSRRTRAHPRVSGRRRSSEAATSFCRFLRQS